MFCSVAWRGKNVWQDVFEANHWWHYLIWIAEFHRDAIADAKPEQYTPRGVLPCESAPAQS